jgi:selenocysteine lyase/cysteine desulfurase
MLMAAGALPFEVAAAGAFAAQPRRAAAGGDEPLAPLGLPPALPDKASFSHVRGTFLDGASSHPRPAGANGLIARAGAAELGDPAGFRPSESRIRAAFARLVHAEPSEIAFVPSTQIGESFVGNAIGLNEPGAHVVSDYLHFVGSQQMYTDMAKRGLEVSWVKIRDNRIPLEDLDRAIVKGRTRLVAVSHTSFVTGFQHDLAAVSEIAHAKGAMVYADIIQGAGNVPLDLAASGVDAACCATYKWLMSPGTAFLYVRAASLAKMRPPFYHFSRYTRLLPATHMYPFDTPAPVIVDDYEPKAGTPGLFSMGYEPNVATLAGLEYSLPYIINIGPAAIQAHAQGITDHLKRELSRRGYQLLTPLDARSPIVTVAIAHADALAPALRAANVRVTTRWNHVRISASVFNDVEDADRAIAALPRM